MFKPLALAGVAALALTACATTPPTSPTTSNGLASFAPGAQAPTGSHVTVKLNAARTTQYMEWEIEDFVVGVYDADPGELSPWVFGPYAFSPDGFFKRDSNPPSTVLAGLTAGYLPYMQELRDLVGNTDGNNARFMIRQLTSGGDFQGGPVTVDFHNLPDGNYKLFAAAAKSGVLIGRTVTNLDVDASYRIPGTYDMPTQQLAVVLEPNPNVPTETTIYSNYTPPTF